MSVNGEYDEPIKWHSIRHSTIGDMGLSRTQWKRTVYCQLWWSPVQVQWTRLVLCVSAFPNSRKRTTRKLMITSNVKEAKRRWSHHKLVQRHGSRGCCGVLFHWWKKTKTIPRTYVEGSYSFILVSKLLLNNHNYSTILCNIGCHAYISDDFYTSQCQWVSFRNTFLGGARMTSYPTP